MREILLSDNTVIRILKKTGIVEDILKSKRVEIQFLNRLTGNVDKRLIIYTRDLDKICDTVKELFEED